MTEKEKKQVSTFAVLKEIDVSAQKSKKMGLDYLSWAYAWNFMKEFDKDSTVEYTKYKQVNPHTFEPLIDSDDVPYCVTPQGTYVEATVTIKNHAEKQMLPVMDYKNKSVKNPDMMQINKALQRAFVKALALHGLGLSLYAGEDLPSENDGSSKQNNQNKNTNQSRNKKTYSPDELKVSIKKLADEYDKLTGTQPGLTLEMAYEYNGVKQETTNISELTKVGKYLKEILAKASKNEVAK